jgi:hypothetical protein
MLPGFRFLFAAIILSMSILVFGLGAAALLRAAHEEFASMPARRAPPEPVFAQANETPPTLAMVRLEPPMAENGPDRVDAISTPAPAADTPAPEEPEKLAALKAEDSAAVKVEESTPAETAKTDPPAQETAPAPLAAPTPPETTASIEETKPTTVTEPLPPASEVAPATPEQTIAAATPEASLAATKIATLGGPAVTIDEKASAKTTDAKPDRSAAKRRARAKALRRAQLARQAIPEEPADPFAPQPTITTRATR